MSTLLTNVLKFIFNRDESLFFTSEWKKKMIMMMMILATITTENAENYN